MMIIFTITRAVAVCEAVFSVVEKKSYLVSRAFISWKHDNLIIMVRANLLSVRFGWRIV